jgi:hypothetical protein
MILERAPNTDVDYVDARGISALLVAALYHFADMIQLLGDRGQGLITSSTFQLNLSRSFVNDSTQRPSASPTTVLILNNGAFVEPKSLPV